MTAPSAASVDRYAVIGNPVSHSLSPVIHGKFAEDTGQALIYDRIEAPEDAFDATAAAFFEHGGLGLNVTLPFKLDAYRWAEERTEEAERAGAVNTLYMEGGARHGANTDGLGLVRDMANLGWSLKRSRILMLGAGGAVRGVLHPLLAAGAGHIAIANRTREKAQCLATQFDIEVIALDALSGGWDIVVNGTSAGVAGEGGLVEASVIEGAHCYDMFYQRDGDTPFVHWALQHGAAAAADGLGMLIEQAAESFALWRGVRPDTAGIALMLRESHR